MSRSRKHVTAQALGDFPTPEEDEKIVRVVSIRGSNILEVEYPGGDKVLALMPAKFNKVIWVKRGNYLIVEPFKEQFKTKEAQQSKLKARIVHILLPDQVKYLQKSSHWPTEFSKQQTADPSEEEEEKEKVADDSEASEEELDEYLINPNHRVVDDSDASESEESDEDGEESSSEEEP